MHVLVGYASAHSSTAEIAQFMGKVLEERNISVTVAKVADVEAVDQFDAFVVGSAIHGGMWLTEFSQFLSRFEDKLAAKPVYIFITCIRLLESDGYEHVVQEYVNHAITDKLGVREIHPFAGKLEMSAVDWEERWSLSARYDGTGTPGSYNNDFRDWDLIRAWISRVGNDLQPA